MADFVAPECGDHIKDLRKLRGRKFGYVIFRFENEPAGPLTVATTGPVGSTLDTFVSEFQDKPNAPCYAIYDHHYLTADGRETDRLVYVVFLPPTAQVASEMFHAQEQGRCVACGCVIRCLLPLLY